MTVTPTGAVGSVTGVRLSLDRPESFANSGALGSAAIDDLLILTPFSPQLLFDKEGGADGQPFEISFDTDTPDLAVRCRLYGQPMVGDRAATLVANGLTGASPSVRFTLEAKLEAGQGVEYAPLIENLTCVATVYQNEGGQQFAKLDIAWTLPANPEVAAQIQQARLVLDTDGRREPLDTLPAYSGAYSVSGISVPIGIAKCVLYGVSVGENGANRIFPSVTPHVNFELKRTTGAAGIEYCANIVPALTFIEVANFELPTADGTAYMRITVNGTKPADVALSFFELRAVTPSGDIHLENSRFPPFQVFFPLPSSFQNWTFYVLSWDVNGRHNTYVTTVTPRQTIGVGTGSGALNLGKFAPGSINQSLTSIGNQLALAYGQGLKLTGSGVDIKNGNGVQVDANGVAVKGNTAAGVQVDANGVALKRGQDIGLDANGNATVTGVDLANSRNMGPNFAVQGGKFVQTSVDFTKADPATFAIGQFKVQGGVMTIFALAANVVNFGILQMGGGGNKVSQVRIFDSSGGSSPIGFWGDDSYSPTFNPLGTGFLGLWSKITRLGGADYTAAPFQTDSTGLLTITFGQNSLQTLLGNQYDSNFANGSTGVSANYFGLITKSDNSNKSGLTHNALAFVLGGQPRSAFGPQSLIFLTWAGAFPTIQASVDGNLGKIFARNGFSTLGGTGISGSYSAGTNFVVSNGLITGTY